MDGRERVIRTLCFESPDRTPRYLGTLPGNEMYRKAELDDGRGGLFAQRE